MSFFRQDRLILERDAPSVVADQSVDAENTTRRQSFRERQKTQSRRTQAERLERDLARGYSINVKQVVLAFAVEFWIISLIVVGTYLLIADSGNLSNEAMFGALLFPSALAMVELARVPLAIAVRTQHAWHIKLFAALGVAAAIVVTTFSLSQLAFKSFDNRLVEATIANDRRNEAIKQQRDFQTKMAQVQQDLEQKEAVRKGINERLKGLEDQLTKIGSNTGQNCKNLLDAEGKPIFGADGKPTQNCTPFSNVNQVQLNTVKSQIQNTKKELDAAQIELKIAEGRKADPSKFESEIVKAEAEYRRAVNKSVLHSYTGTITGKAVADVTEAEVKNLEKWLIFIPSIAAALASTFIAITAVRRIRRPETEPVAVLPDEAMQFILGPMVKTFETEVKRYVSDAMRHDSRQKTVPEAVKT